MQVVIVLVMMREEDWIPRQETLSTYIHGGVYNGYALIVWCRSTSAVSASSFNANVLSADRSARAAQQGRRYRGYIASQPYEDDLEDSRRV